MRIQNLLRFPDSLHRRANNLTFSGIESDASPTRQDSSLDRLPAGNVTHQVGRQDERIAVSTQQRNKSAFRESATDGSAESTCDDDLNFQDMRSLFQDLDLDRDSEIQITKWSLQFTNESLEEEFMMRRAEKNKPHIIIISLITLILAICFTGLYYLEGSTTLVGFGIVIIFCIANFLAYVRYSRHYVSLSTAGQILVAYHLERNDRRLFRTRKLDAEYKSRLLAKEAKTNDILRKTYPPFVADELRSASSLHSLSHTSKHALIIHMRIHFGLAQTSLNSEQSAQVFTWLREFQVFVDKLCRRSEVKNLCKVKFSGDMTLMVCGIGQPMTNFDVENTIRLIDRLVLHVQSRHSAQQARLVVVASIGPVESGIVVCQKQSYDVYGAGLSSSLVLLDRVWLSSEHGQSLFVVTTDVCNHAEGEYDKVSVDGVSSSQQLYQRVSLRIASKSKRHKEGTTDETQAEFGALRVMHERIYDDEVSESTKSVSLGAQEDGHGLCLLPGEAARYEQDFQLIAYRESYLHQLKLLKAAVPYVSMLVLWSIYWGSMEYSIFVDAGIQSSDEIMQLMFVRFFVILPCIVLWTAWCGFEIEWLEREPDGFALQCFTFGLRCCVVVQGLFVSSKVAALFGFSGSQFTFTNSQHAFFRNEFLLWTLLSTTISLSQKRDGTIFSLFWCFSVAFLLIFYQSETEYSTILQLSFYIILYVFCIAAIIFYQSKSIHRIYMNELESNILIQKEIHRSKVEQLIAERIVLSVIPDSLYHSITDGSFVNTPHFSRMMVVVVNVSHFCSSTASLHAEFKAQVLSELFSFLEMFASRYNITPLKTFADRYIFYGDSSESSDVHVQCLRFAMDLQSLCQVGLSLPHETHCRLKIGAAFGGVVGGIIDANGLSYDLLGDCVTNANVLSRLCPVDQVLIDESAHSLVESCREYAYYEFGRHRSDVHGKCFVVQESDDIWARFMSHIDWMKDD